MGVPSREGSSGEIFSPMFFCFAATAAGHQKGRILLPGTCSRTWCNIQLRIRYSDVNPSVSSSLSPARILLSVHRWDYLGTERSNCVLSMVRVSTLKRKVLWIEKPYKSVIEANAKTTISKKSLADMT